MAWRPRYIARATAVPWAACFLQYIPAKDVYNAQAGEHTTLRLGLAQKAIGGAVPVYILVELSGFTQPLYLHNGHLDSQKHSTVCMCHAMAAIYRLSSQSFAQFILPPYHTFSAHSVAAGAHRSYSTPVGQNAPADSALPPASGPLVGIKVLDLGQVVAGKGTREP